MTIHTMRVGSSVDVEIRGPHKATVEAEAGEWREQFARWHAVTVVAAEQPDGSWIVQGSRANQP